MEDWYDDFYCKLSKSQRKQYAVVAGMYDPTHSGAIRIMTNGPMPEVIAPELLEASARAGVIGQETVAGTIVGRCAEFRGTNDLILTFGSRLKDIRFVGAMRPLRKGTGMIAREFCDNCIVIFFDEICESPVFYESPNPIKFFDWTGDCFQPR